MGRRVTQFSEQIRQRMERFERRPIYNPALTSAAVALVVTEEPAGACIILTQRSLALSRHAGQYALPGGRLDAGESATDAALRELDEEVGLNLEPSAVLGILDDFETRSGFCITPVVVWGGDAPQLTAEPREVGAIHRVPIAELRREPLIDLEPIAESTRPVLSMVLQGIRVFTPTAALIYQWREVALFDRTTRVFNYEQPVFAWR